MNKNLKNRADRLLSSIYLDGYEHGYKDAIQNISNFMKLEPMYYPQVDGITPTVVAESDDKNE